MKSFIKYSLSALAAIALLYWSFSSSGVEWQKIVGYFKEADYGWVIASLIISILAHILRGLRWNQLLNTLNYHPTGLSSFMAVMVGYIANFVFPRMGEISRCAALTKTDHIPFEKSFGTVITERILDLLSMIIVLFITLIWSFEPIQEFLFPNFTIKEHQGLLIGLVIGFILFGFSIYYLIQTKKIRLELLENIPIIGKFMKGLSDGLTSALNIQNPALFFLYSLLIWFFYYLGIYFLFLAFPITSDLSWTIILTTFTMGTVGMIIPTQGGIGSYHSLVATTLVFYGLESSDGFALATFFHGTQMATILLFGIVGIAYMIIYSKKKHADKN